MNGTAVAQLWFRPTSRRSVGPKKEVEWFLLVEKESILQRLDLGEKAVAVAGNGYHDVVTRVFEKVADRGRSVVKGHPAEDAPPGIQGRD